MAILVDDSTRVVVSGITGRERTFHALRNRAYGTQVVAGVTPGKGGQDVEGTPVFDTVAEAVAATGADASFVAVPPKAAPAAILEAAMAGIAFVVTRDQPETERQITPAAASEATPSETPTATPTCRKVSLMPAAMPLFSFGTTLSATSAITGFSRPMPIPPTMKPSTSEAITSSGVSLESRNCCASMPAKPRGLVLSCPSVFFGNRVIPSPQSVCLRDRDRRGCSPDLFRR